MDRGCKLHPPSPPDGPGVYGLPYAPAESWVHLLPVPYEATVSYGTGTRRGPAAILDASPQLDLLDPDFGRPYRVGLHCRAAPRGLAALQAEVDRVRSGRSGDARQRQVINRASERMVELVKKSVAALIAEGRLVGVLGGEHAVAFPAIAAHAEAYGEIGVLQVDAHQDLRRAYQGYTWSHASVMDNVLEHLPSVSRLVQVGIRDSCDEEELRARRSGGRVTVYSDRELRESRMAGRGFRNLAREIVAGLPRWVYVSFDIDGLDPSLCPHTGTPVPGGLSFHETAVLLDELARSGKQVAGFDLVEVAPGKGSEWDGNVACRVLYKIVGAAVASRISSLTAR